VGPTMDLMRTIEAIARRKGVFRPEAYLFVLQALESAMADQDRRRHVSGESLLEYVRDLGKTLYGPMAGDVFNSWGVRCTLDFGRIVFHLVDADLLKKRDEDTLADFLDKFDFQKEFRLKVHEAEG
jgi:uncharacterized repeat protein (TIGR04138 family)